MKTLAKVEALDFVIQVLKEHEKKLDRLAERLESVLGSLKRTREPEAIEEARRLPEMPATASLMQHSNWLEFRRACSRAKILAFHLEEGVITMTCLAGNFVHLYSEPIPKARVLLACGYETTGVSAQLDRQDFRRWLSEQTGVRLEQISEGVVG